MSVDTAVSGGRGWEGELGHQLRAVQQSAKDQTWQASDTSGPNV